jgi:phosphotransferase family enzyme
MSKTVTSIADEEISALSAVLNPMVLRRYLASILPARWGALRDIELQVLKHHRGRTCAVEITLQTTNGTYELIGKAYAKDRSDVFQVMERLSRNGFSIEERFSIPKPLAYIPLIRLLLYEKVNGARAKDIFSVGDDHSRCTAAKRSAQWLARFHATEPHSEKVVTLSDHLILMEKWTQQLSNLGYPLECKAKCLYKKLKVRASTLNSVTACASHGSYSHDQIIFAAGHTVTIDWDGYRVADPRLDVAKFIIELRRLALNRFGSIRALDSVAEVFRQTYLGASKPGTTAQVTYYEAATCLKAAENLVKHQSHDWSNRAEALLNEGLRILECGVDENASAA